jgi:ubiquinone/menaquinone biosynthesis C-methylase UbiE
MQRAARAPVNFAIKSVYALYLRSFSGVQEVIPERIIEYPFAARHFKQLAPGSRVAVTGCYGDLLTTLLPAMGLEVVGIDIKEFPLEAAGFSFKKSDLRHIELPDASFDGVAAVSTIEHVGLFDGDPDGDRKAVAEFKRLLKPKGLFVITVPFAADATVISMNQRIYDRASLTRLLDGFDIKELAAYAYSSEKAWSAVPVEKTPASNVWHETHSTALVAAEVR